MRKPIALGLVLFLAACATGGPTAYGPADDGRFGYAETRVEQDRFRITYQGSADVPASTVERLALLRAAEITREEGYDWFRVVARAVDAENRGGVSVGAGVGSGSFGRRGGVGVGVGGDLGRIGARRFFTAQLEILLGSGPVPEDRADVYDARSVLANSPEIYPQGTPQIDQ